LFVVAFLGLSLGADAAPSFEVQHNLATTLVDESFSLNGDGVRAGDRAIAPLADLVLIQRLPAALPSRPVRDFVELTTGERLVGRVIGLNQQGLHFSANSIAPAEQGKPMTIPIGFVRRVQRRQVDPPPKLAASGDTLVFANGDVATGSVIGIDPAAGSLSWLSSTGRSEARIENLAALFFDPRSARGQPLNGAQVRVILRDGARLTLAQPTIDQKLIEGELSFRGRARIKLDELVRLEAINGRAVALSDLPPASFRYRSFNGEQATWRADEGQDGSPLRLKSRGGPTLFDRGISTMGECELTYALDGQFRTFQSAIGLDPVLGANGAVDIRVEVDGEDQAAGRVDRLRLETGVVRLHVELTGARTLKLRTKWSAGGIVGDYVNWCDARLIRK
jgi:hypothetical protein